MLQYLVANCLPSGVGSEKAISSLVRWLPYTKLLLKQQQQHVILFIERYDNGCSGKTSQTPSEVSQCGESFEDCSIITFVQER